MVNDTVIGKFTNSFYIPIVPFPDGNGRTNKGLPGVGTVLLTVPALGFLCFIGRRELNKHEKCR